MRGLDRLALARSSEAREDASRGDPQPAETCRRPLAPAPPCSCRRAPPTLQRGSRDHSDHAVRSSGSPARSRSCRIADPLQRGSDRPVLALSSTAPPPRSCSVSLPSFARMRTAHCPYQEHTVYSVWFRCTRRLAFSQLLRQGKVLATTY